MAGNANSGNRTGGKSITEMIQRSARKAIKQGEAGLGGRKALDQLLGDLMQSDVSAFLKAVSPFVPREVVVDHSISIVSALEQARQRIIDVTPQSALLDHQQQAFVPSPGLGQTQQAIDAVCDEEDSQGEV